MERDYYFDNVKGALITLVVIGHFLLPMERTRFVGSVVNIIYLFHMPMFAMVSGYFAKNLYRQGKYRTDRVIRLVWLYILFKIAAHVTENLAAGTPVTWQIDFIKESGAPWYLMAMLWWLLSVPCMAELKPRAVLGICLCLGVFSGYQDSLKYTLAMDRALAFAPFFYGGYYWEREKVQRFLDSRYRWVFPAGAVCISAVTALGTDRFLKPFAKIVYGIVYRSLAPEVYVWGGIARVICYVWGMILILGLMAVIPQSRRWWTFLGQRTLQVYICHRLLRDMMLYWGFYEVFTSVYRRTVLFVMALAVLAAFALASPQITKVFRQIEKVPDSLYKKWKAA